MAKSNSIPAQLNAQASIKALVSDTLPKCQAYELAKLENHDALNPRDTKERLLKELAASTDLSAIAAKQVEIAKFSGPDAEAVRVATHNAMLAAYEPARLALIALAEEMDARMQAFKAQAVEDEQKLFCAHGLPRTATPCSTRFDAPIAMVRRHKADLESPGYISTGGLPQAQHPVLSFLGATV